MTVIFTPIGQRRPFAWAMARTDDDDHDDGAPDDRDGVPWPDAPTWLKAAVLLIATGVWAFIAISDAQEGRKPQTGTLIVFIVVMVVLFGRELVKAVRR